MNMIKQIENFESIVKQHPELMLDLPVKHYFSQGVYARQLFIPKGAIVTGKIHKYQQLNILLKGRIRVLIDNEMVEIVAPFIVVSPPGTKRIAEALEDCQWLTIHGTEERDLNKIEQHYVVDTEQQYLEFCSQQPELPLVPYVER